MLLELAASKHILFFGGKGGVGKTTIAAATALALARQGKHILLVSTDPAHNLGHIWQRKIGAEKVALAANLDGIEIDPEKTTRKHLENVAAALRKLMPEHLWGEVDKHIALARDAPGMHEAAILERIAEIVERGLQDYDLVVFDTAPSGHTARLMALPEIMSVWTEGLLKRQRRSESFDEALSSLGSKKTPDTQARDERIQQILNRRRDLFTRLREVLSDTGKTSFVVVLAAERLPVLETIELEKRLKKTGVPVAALIVNKRSLPEQGAFLAERHTQEAQHLQTLRKVLPKTPLIQLPLLASDVVGEEHLIRFGELLMKADRLNEKGNSPDMR
ncbi:MAG: ArsA family ATPase [Burkholderiales bacterium]|jgi:arsenite-transporting ATPase|nr:ArsA family ATPase [Burkholderiales bacterium]